MASPHEWQSSHDTMPPLYICVHCGVSKMLDERKAVTVFWAANGWEYGAAEPQCRRDNLPILEENENVNGNRRR